MKLLDLEMIRDRLADATGDPQPDDPHLGRDLKRLLEHGGLAGDPTQDILVAMELCSLSGIQWLEVATPDDVQHVRHGMAHDSSGFIVTSSRVEDQVTIKSETVSLAMEARWYAARQIVDLKSGTEFKPVPQPEAPSPGCYSVNFGTYRFHPGDNGRAIKVAYMIEHTALAMCRGIIAELWLNCPERLVAA